MNSEKEKYRGVLFGCLFCDRDTYKQMVNVVTTEDGTQALVCDECYEKEIKK